MTESISYEIFKHLVNLAALELSPEEADYLYKQLNNQLKSIRELEAIPIDPDTPLNLHGIEYTPQIRQESRPDQWSAYTNTEAILNQSPESEERYIVVPDIPHTELK